MSTLNISLSEPMQNFVDAEVAEGGYTTTSEYLSALIREAQERKASRHLEELRRDVRHGFAQIERGEYTEYASGKESADRIIAEGRRRMAEQEAAL